MHRLATHGLQLLGICFLFDSKFVVGVCRHCLWLSAFMDLCSIFKLVVRGFCCRYRYENLCFQPRILCSFVLHRCFVFSSNLLIWFESFLCKLKLFVILPSWVWGRVLKKIKVYCYLVFELFLFSVFLYCFFLLCIFPLLVHWCPFIRSCKRLLSTLIYSRSCSD